MATTTITRDGDAWDLISRRVYGNEGYMEILMDANIKYVRTVTFAAGVVLNVPILTTPVRTFPSPPWKKLVQLT